MSKYLKWYDSYLDHTPTEDLAKNELESAHRKIKQLTESLAKANERVKELEHGNRACAIAIRELVERGDIEPLMVGNDALDKIVNKFTIEKKIEALRKFEPISNAVANHWCDKEQKGYLWLHAEILAEIEKLEQLRKEQE